MREMREQYRNNIAYKYMYIIINNWQIVKFISRLIGILISFYIYILNLRILQMFDYVKACAR